MRREIVEAVRASVCPCMDEDACGNRGLTDEDAEAIARAVLRASVAAVPVAEAMTLIRYMDGRPRGEAESLQASWLRTGLLVTLDANPLNLSRDLVSEANVTSNASIAAGGNDGE